MKKLFALVTIIGLMIGGLGMNGLSINANAYTELGEPLPARPVEDQ